MADENMTLRIDPNTRDLVLDENGNMEQIYGDETTAQCVRLTLQTWKGEFFLDDTHGTEYDRILGKKPHELPEDEVGEVLREAIFQETDVAQVDDVTAEIGDKTVSAAFNATLYSGRKIGMEVKT
ncbi:DUF2634 domain-containing protein [Desulfitobacterium sp.]|uniref:contractile injection system sheath initiator n=1 Tax=Desulfitobacterium sp. TaxID=49981 RepID=UPI002B1FE189|nr:DUF2634 domain-containing protein [Desulfitobacterium sp.]MEA4901847.1 DUF2634 domain-containing protein [Desulfitobacterium sp.]